MALRTKNKRKITVGENVFYWILKAQGTEDILRLTVMTEEKAHSRLICKFRYKSLWFSGFFENGKHYEDEFLGVTGGILTPSIVRRIIDHALRKGWKPLEKGADFVIAETDAKIDTNFGSE